MQQIVDNLNFKGLLFIHSVEYLPNQIEGRILGLQSISRDVAHNASHPRRLDPTMELIIKYSFVLYLQHGRHDVKCKPSISRVEIQRSVLFCRSKDRGIFFQKKTTLLSRCYIKQVKRYPI